MAEPESKDPHQAFFEYMAKHEPNKLYPAILEELQGMDDIIIEEAENSETNLRTLLELGEIVIRYETQRAEVPRTFLGKKLWTKVIYEPLTNLTELQEQLAKNPEIGEPARVKDDELHYEAIAHVPIDECDDFIVIRNSRASGYRVIITQR